MKKLSLISSLALIFMFGIWLVGPAPALASPGLEVVPTEYDFGDVELGSSSSTIITITNNDFESYYIDDVSLQAGGSSDFSITLAPPPGKVLTYGESADVGITYTPSAEGYVSATLDIAWKNADSGIDHVALGGVGVGTAPPPGSVQDILAFFDASLANRTLYGDGPGKSANGRRKALRNMIKASGDLIDDGYIAEACQQLMVAYQRCDGLPRPPEFVAGPAASELAQMILDLMASLGCQ